MLTKQSVSQYMFVWIVGLKGKQRFKKNNVFANFLLGTIMQDSDIRKALIFIIFLFAILIPYLSTESSVVSYNLEI